MPRIVCHHKEKFNVFSTVSDAFHHDNALSLEELRSEYKGEVDGFTSASLEKQVERAIEMGVGLNGYHSLSELLEANRAGPSEEHLSVAECISRFLS